ncbi:hypothetical protein DPMN_033066 [Dreissena polymorpha]|uniref:Uncharacterized protein n=1 Tax=Dreissena polymorpha TaxID=45954 RepID=A0A9D4M6B5_DREPO|nr:hypothetical protein DPMN_033066 [Dreissena polymorpha]
MWRSESSDLKKLRVVDPVGTSVIELTLCIKPYDSTERHCFYRRHPLLLRRAV